MLKFLVQTTASGSVEARRTWLAMNIRDAEGIARRLSVGAMRDPKYPNPFEVVCADGTLHCQYHNGVRLEHEVA